MKRVCRRKVIIDALTMCYEVEESYHYEQLGKLNFGECYDLYEFRLYRVEGRYYQNIYNIITNNGTENIEFGQLKFNLNRGLTESNTHDNGKTKTWISFNNRTLYSDDIHFLSYIDAKLGLVPHNITNIDLALDTPFNVSTQIKKLIRNKNVTTMLNGKQIKNRDEDRPEITYTLSGNLNRDKYMTVNIKQKKAIRDKAKGTTVISYDKEAEIRNSSGKEYILAYYGNPTKLYRTEVHLNHEQIKDYFQSQENEWKRFYGFLDEAIREELFFHHLNSVIHFKHGREEILWEQLLGRRVA